MNVKQLKTLNLLKQFLEIANKHQLKYSIFYGSMLGAIRHDGFIPWDDDIDILVPKESWDILIKTYPTFLKHSKNSNNPLLFGKFTNDSETDEDATFLDIFVAVKTTKKNLRKYNSLTTKIRYLKNFTKRKLFKCQWGMKIVKFFSIWTWLWPKLSFEQAYEMLNDTCGDIDFVITWPSNKEVKRASKVTIDWNNLISVKFEDVQVNIFKNYKDFFVSTYGPNWNIPKKYFMSRHLGLYDMDVFTKKKKENKNHEK
ncbi:diacylglycerol cholinephosphotransferase Mf1 [Mycoplasma zalophidermidis]|uniref:LicD family protein n=1 Tax=Mycoplasma zalophidermidis TaxID=398174 RepID=A0ABS6DR67_9MOLU|nr:LicD family protein [Mycoplasma zalophidermidis]MBU4689439.1 LicD family protein [Mycoplasma zalophidermidis]MBU4693316.1 LicD family protein [Mycoplasma zalophidermidis]MCR8966385.1 LicD family protein [Mycoplasma zalophidermidis]